MRLKEHGKSLIMLPYKTNIVIWENQSVIMLVVFNWDKRSNDITQVEDWTVEIRILWNVEKIRTKRRYKMSNKIIKQPDFNKIS